jgi:hypothetical protein
MGNHTRAYPDICQRLKLPELKLHLLLFPLMNLNLFVQRFPLFNNACQTPVPSKKYQLFYLYRKYYIMNSLIDVVCRRLLNTFLFISAFGTFFLEHCGWGQITIKGRRLQSLANE